MKFLKKWFFTRVIIANWEEALIVVIAFLFLGTLYCYYGDFEPEANIVRDFWTWIDPVSTIGTFVLAIFILYYDGRERYINSLESRLSVDYTLSSEQEPILKIKYAYLSGESDIRQWSQQLGRQVFNVNLAFDMNWDDDYGWKIEKINDKYYKHYYIKLFLYNDPIENKNRDVMTFIENHDDGKFKHSKISGTLDNLPLIWERID